MNAFYQKLTIKFGVNKQKLTEAGFEAATPRINAPALHQLS